MQSVHWVVVNRSGALETFETLSQRIRSVSRKRPRKKRPQRKPSQRILWPNQSSRLFSFCKDVIAVRRWLEACSVVERVSPVIITTFFFNRTYRSMSTSTTATVLLLGTAVYIIPRRRFLSIAALTCWSSTLLVSLPTECCTRRVSEPYDTRT